MNENLKNYSWYEHSNYWLDDETYNKVLKSKNLGTDIPIGELVSKHKIIKTIKNFIDIINDEGSSNINVMFAGQGAATDGKTLTISSDVEDFDLLAGLSLHESSHLQYSKAHFRILGKINHLINMKTLRTSGNEPEGKFIQDMFDHFRGMGLSLDTPTSYLCLLANFIEDARVDRKVISRYPGYEPYYDALNRKYVYSDEAQNRLNALDGETWKNYLAKILLLIMPDSDLSVLKGLQEISDTIDLSHINRLTGGLDVFNLSFEVFKIIQKHIQTPETPKSNNKNQAQKQQSGNGQGQPQEPDMDQENEESESTSSGNGKDKNDDENEDKKDEDKTTSKNESDSGDEDEDEKNEDSNNDENENKNEENETDDGENENKDEPNESSDEDFEFSDGSDIMEQILKALGNEYEKQEMTEGEKEAYSLITNQSVLTRSVAYLGDKVDTILIKDITDRALLEKFQCTRFLSPTKPYRLSIEQGIRKGRLLASRLATMNDVKNIDSIRKEAGKLDARLLPEFGHGNTKIFKSSTVGKYQDTNIHITIDNSGSMCGDDFDQALQMGTMFAVASLYIKGLEVQVSVRSTSHTLIGSDTPYVAIIFDSLMKHDIKYIRKYMAQVTTTGLTPEGLCFAVIKDYIKECSKAKNSLFINISDGAPSCYGGSTSGDFHGVDAVNFTAVQVKDITKSGIKVISFFVGGDEDDSCGRDFKKMYGQYSYFVDVVQPLKVATVFNKGIKKA